RISKSPAAFPKIRGAATTSTNAPAATTRRSTSPRWGRTRKRGRMMTLRIGEANNVRLPIADCRLPIDPTRSTARSSIGNRQSAIGSRSAFTLVELILILAVIAITAALVLPRLSGFFRGRVLDSETRQLLALMHHGQSRAVSAGVPMVLWIDEKQSTYGLEEEPGYSDKDPDAVEFTLDKDLQFEIQKPDAGTAPRPAPTTTSGPRADLPSIRF